VHIRRRLQQAGILPGGDYYDISPKGYSGAHYAVWPPELCRLLIDEMCPRRVCVVCGQPSRRIVEQTMPRIVGKVGKSSADARLRVGGAFGAGGANVEPATYETLGWSDCGCEPPITCGQCKATPPCTCGSTALAEYGERWRPGRILDPFAGSGTTLMVASGMGRDSVGIDIDERNAHLAEQRCGMFLEIDWGTVGPTDQLPPREIIDAVENL
jgi:hypothetical protein